MIIHAATTAVLPLFISVPYDAPQAHAFPALTVVHKVGVSDQFQRSWLAKQNNDILDLRPNWDGYGADPIEYHIVSKLFSVLERYDWSTSLNGKVVPGADGSLQAEWHYANKSIGLLIESDGTTRVWLDRAGGELSAAGSRALEMFDLLATSELNARRLSSNKGLGACVTL